MKLRCIHCSDVHIGVGFNSATFGSKYGKKRRKEILNTFLNIIEEAKEIDAHFLFVCGDLFEDEYCSISDIKIVSSKFKEAINTKIIIISGNHDYLHNNSLYNLISWPENVHFIQSSSINKIEFEDLNTVIWGLSWHKKEEKQQLLSDIPLVDNEKINILLAHGDILNANSNYLPIDKNHILSKGFDYVALGHIHKPMFISENIAYSGSPEPLDFSETGSHGIIEGVITKDKLQMEFKPFSRREFVIKNIDINPNMSYLDVLECIKKCDEVKNREKNLYRIVLNGIRDIDIHIDTTEIQEDLENHFKYIEVIDNTHLDYNLERLLKDNQNNIIGKFIEEMINKDLENPIIKDALYYGLNVLLSEKVKL